MKTNRRHAAAALGSVLAAGILSGVAVASNPHGTPPGQAKQQAPATTTSAGVKPSSTTQHNTNAAAGSNQTKSYGNGKTAGQIAQQNGASPSTNLHGPGNSQPHKVQVCSKNGKSHEVDVHALKSQQGSSCTTGSTSGAAGASHATHGKSASHGASGSQAASSTKGNSANAHEHVTICHATPPDTAANGYVLISPSAAGVYNGHLKEHAADIIPPFTYNGQTYSLNWDATGQAIFANGCVVPTSTSSAAAAQAAAAAKATANAVLGAFKSKSSVKSSQKGVSGVKGAQKTVGAVKGARKTVGRVAGRARAPRAVTGSASFAG